MVINEALQYMLDGNATLFTGAGFNYGVLNLNNQPIPNAIDLAKAMLDEIKYPYSDYEQINLNEASTAYIKFYNNGTKRLIEFLRKNLMPSELKHWQNNICSLNWRNIFTTNYDNVIEKGFDNNKKDIISISAIQEYAGELPNGSTCIHLNGFLGDNYIFANDSALRLTESSLVTTIIPEEWKEIFRLALRTSRVCIFIGFSGRSDIAVKQLLAIENLKQKCFFIVGPSESQQFIDTLENYGYVLPIGVEKFSELVAEYKKSYIPSLTIPEYKSFKLIESCNEINDPAIGFKVNNLFRYGKFDDSLLIKRKNDYIAVINRTELSTIIKHICKPQNTGFSIFVLHSYLGNGKTVALRVLENELAENSIVVYRFIKLTNEVFDEIIKISKTPGKKVVTIESYLDYLDLAKYFRSYSDENLTLILTARSPLHESTGSLIFESWKKVTTYKSINLNRINRNDTYNLKTLLDNYGLWGDSLKYSDDKMRIIERNCKSQFSDIALATVDSIEMKSRFKNIVFQIKNRERYYKLVLFCILRCLLEIKLNIEETLELFDDEIGGNLTFKQNNNVRELLDFNTNDFNLESSIVAHKLIQEEDLFIDSINVISDVIKKADKIKDINSVYSIMLRNLVNYKLLSSSFKVKPDKMLEYYDKIRITDFCKNNHSYWEQFALACLAANRFPDALQYVNYAYSLVEKNKTFIPFQIDNIKAKILLEREMYNISHIKDYKTTNRQSILDTIREAHNLLFSSHEHPLDRVIYAIEDAGDLYPKLYRQLHDILQKSEIQLIKEMINESILFITKYYQRETSLEERQRLDIIITRLKLLA